MLQRNVYPGVVQGESSWNSYFYRVEPNPQLSVAMMIPLRSLVLAVLLPTFTYGWFELCDQQFQLGGNADVQLLSPLYPNRKYPSGSSCRYTLIAPPGNSIQMTCDINIDTAQSTACSTELFYISTEGFSSLVGSEYFCGKGSISRNSLFNKMMIAYTSSSNTNGGTFNCRIKVVKQDCDCGWSRWQKIVGGTEAGINEYTSIVGLLDKLTASVFCSGVIISYRYILTAAHCVQNIPNSQRLQALVGDHDYKTGLETPYSQIYDIESIVMHENYNQDSRDNDIAVLKTTADMQWTRGVGPVCLPFNYWYYDFNKLQVDVAGWGTTSYGGQTSTTLRRVTLDVIANADCTKAQYVNNQKLCTYTPGKDTCQYDSGGPLYLRGVQRMYTIGIVSYGGACAASTPSVNTRITAYLTWIQNKTTDATYCVK